MRRLVLRLAFAEQIPYRRRDGFPSGRRAYYADYRTKTGTRRRMSLGPHGKLTVEEARKLAIVTLGDVIRGEDPAEECATRRNSIKVSELCDAYLAAELARAERSCERAEAEVARQRRRLDTASLARAQCHLDVAAAERDSARARLTAAETRALPLAQERDTVLTGQLAALDA